MDGQTLKSLHHESELKVSHVKLIHSRKKRNSAHIRGISQKQQITIKIS